MTHSVDEPPAADEWIECGLDPWLVTQCVVHGWSFEDLTSVLCAHTPTQISADALNFGIDPLEIIVMLAEGRQTPERSSARAITGSAGRSGGNNG